VTTVLDALLALQSQDDVVDGLASRLAALAPRRASLDAARDGSERTLRETRVLVEGDEKKQRELEGRLADHRLRHERNVAHLDSVKRLREATAAMTQVEAGRKLLLEEENELRALSARVADGHAVIRKQEKALAELEASQTEARAVLADEEDELRRELAAANAVRNEIAHKVNSGLLQKYDRIRGRRHAQAIFALNGSACSCCDTAVPVQRRKMMATTGAIGVCEACGVLLYASV
jgi:predicted  nucleic acid-binding Zn-ribbon protein